jgi:hypothetical protein
MQYSVEVPIGVRKSRDYEWTRLWNSLLLGRLGLLPTLLLVVVQYLRTIPQVSTPVLGGYWLR